MELLTITLAANETKQFAKAGRYFEIIDSTYAVNVAFNAANGAQSDQMVGALSGLYLEDPFAHFAITNGAVAQTLILLVMEVGRGGSRRQPGVVRIVDSERDKVRSNTVFWSGVSQVGGAQGPSAQIYNPAGSGKVLTVYRVYPGALTADIWNMTLTTTPLPTLAGSFSSLLAGGADSSAERRTDNTGSALAGAKALGGGFIAASQTIDVPVPRPIVLNPGFGLVIGLGTAGAGQTNRTTFAFEENLL